jgi:RNA polymerase sigma factor (TIGR02999 family)
MKKQDDLSDITTLLRAWSEGDPEALDLLVPQIYEQLSAIARNHLKGERQNHTLQTSALVNEVYLQLVNQKNLHFENRRQFFYYAGRIMRHILVGHARHRLAGKRGKGVSDVPLEEGIPLADGQNLSLEKLVILDATLERLEQFDFRQARIVELRFFAGFNNSEVADILKISLTTLKHEWKLAKLWLARELEGGAKPN